MKYHHIILGFSGSDAVVSDDLMDLSEQDLRKLFVEPYKKGQSILVNGKVVATADIRSVLIIRTAREKSAERDALNRQHLERIDRMNRESDSVVILSPGHGYEPEDIAEAGEDVTAEFIKGPPGYASNGWLKSAIHNPWVVTLGGGLILAGAIAWLGW